VTIIGAGLGGIALVANLGLLGYRLRLHDRDEARIAKVRERGRLDVEGLAKGFALDADAAIATAQICDRGRAVRLVAMSELGRAAGVATPVIDGLITLTSTRLRRDFRSEGRILAQLGLAGKTVGKIRSIVEAARPRCPRPWPAARPTNQRYFGPNTSMAIRPAFTAQGQPA
jgi:hypothetical protein